MPLFDTHAHLDEQSFDTDRTSVLSRALDAGLTGIVTIGTTLASSRLALALAEEFPFVYAAVGIHPNYSLQASPHDFSEIAQLAQHPRVVAIGETGLDKYWDFAPLDIQKEFFAQHLELARQVQKPFVVHCRDAEAETLQILQQATTLGPLQGIMHSFCGGLAMAQQCLDWGLHLSFAGMLTYKRNDELRAVAQSVPLDRLLIETDSPYLSPVPFRGKRNEPAYVVHTARCLAELKGFSLEELSQLTTTNAHRLFGIPQAPSQAACNPPD